MNGFLGTIPQKTQGGDSTQLTMTMHISYYKAIGPENVRNRSNLLIYWNTDVTQQRLHKFFFSQFFKYLTVRFIASWEET